jgi:hypothetical protein
MTGRHKAQRESLVVIRTAELQGNIEKVARRASIRMITRPGVKFPILHKRIRPDRRYTKVFQANRPNLFC